MRYTVMIRLGKMKVKQGYVELEGAASYIYRHVVADSEEEARQKALAAIDKNLNPQEATIL